MKKRRIYFLLIYFSLISCGTKPKETVEKEIRHPFVDKPIPSTVQEDSIFPENFNCKKGLMTHAWYTMGQDESPPTIPELKQDFIILVDTNLKATNFISYHESYDREQSTKLDTSDLNWTEGWNKLSLKQKLQKVKQERIEYRIQADSAHIFYNNGQQQVWIINNSSETVTIQMQDWSFICVLQAWTKKGQWRPIQYWEFSTCGNSYYYKDFAPQTASSFVTILPKKGDYKTKLRYKILGKDRYYYSNEFEGTINYCEFVEDTASNEDNSIRSRSHWKMEKFKDLVMF